MFRCRNGPRNAGNPPCLRCAGVWDASRNKCRDDLPLPLSAQFHHDQVINRLVLNGDSAPTTSHRLTQTTAFELVELITTYSTLLGRYPGRLLIRHFFPGSFVASIVIFRNPSFGFGFG